MRALLLIKQAMPATVGTATVEHLASISGLHPDIVSKHLPHIKSYLGSHSMYDPYVGSRIKGFVESRETGTAIKNAGKSLKPVGYLALGGAAAGGVAYASS